MKIIIDRIEGDFAVVELPDSKFCNVPLSLVPEGATEGSVIDIICNDDIGNRPKRIRKKMDKLFAE